LKLKKYRGEKKDWEKTHRVHYHFKEGEEKLNDELDVVNLLKTMRRVKLLTQTLMTQTQKMVLRFQRRNIIESSSSSGDSDTNNKFDQMNLMENRNPMVRLVFFGKLKKMIQGYKSHRLNMIDKKLLRGLFVKNIREFDENLRDKGSIPLV
jgi:hypothetical protein